MIFYRNQLFTFCFLTLVLLTGLTAGAGAQAGITVSPSRLYFQPGAKTEQKLTITNPNKDRSLELGISLNDWAYDSLGNNITYEPGTLPTSCARNVQILPGTYFTLAGGETKEISVVMTADTGAAVPIRTAMLYLTQLNPGDATSGSGAAIKVTVRMGIKLYATNNAGGVPDMDITDFVTEEQDGKTTGLKLYVNNTGNIWLDGKINYEVMNKETGKKTKLDFEEFYSLPGDHRIFKMALPATLAKGNYTATAIINYGKNDGLKLAELDFAY
jgi:P pilus assembly chaperone PapD